MSIRDNFGPSLSTSGLIFGLFGSTDCASVLIFGLVLFFTLFACLIVHKRDLSGIGQMFKIFPIDF